LALAVAVPLGGCDGGSTKYIGFDRPTIACSQAPTAPPQSLRLDPFYQKYLDATGIPVLGSSQPSDAALAEACTIVVHMLEARPDVRDRMIALDMRVVAIGQNEVTTSIPEYSNLYQMFPGNDWDSLRGVGATLMIPVSSFGEENMLCLANDPYRGENVLAQTFASAVLLGVEDVDGTFQRRLQNAYNAAMNAGLWQNTFAASDDIEYYAVGVQSWFDAGNQASPPNGVYNDVNTRTELKAYDPTLAGLIGETMPDDAWRVAHCP
jgi:hypothetical protein